MVYVYAANIAGLPDPNEFPECMDGLSRDRKQKILRCRQQKSRKQSLGAGLLLKYVLERHGVSLEEIFQGENGKPKADKICFNLSHSGDVVVCAVSKKAVGCDVELVKKAPQKIAKRFFSEKEIAYLERFTDDEKEEEFYRLWTMKESYMKMTGEGMRLGLNRFELIFEERVKVVRDGRRVSCFMKEYQMSDYKLTVCAEDSEFVEKIEYIDLLKQDNVM